MMEEYIQSLDLHQVEPGVYRSGLDLPCPFCVSIEGHLHGWYPTLDTAVRAQQKAHRTENQCARCGHVVSVPNGYWLALGDEDAPAVLCPRCGSDMVHQSFRYLAKTPPFPEAN